MNTINSIFHNKGYRYIKITGLALGMAVTILIGLWSYNELSFNKYNNNYSSVTQVYFNNANETRTVVYTNNVLTTAMGTLLKNNYSHHFSKIAMVRARVENRVLATNEAKFTEKGYFMQPDGADIFDLQIIYGSRKGLNNINSILLSHSVATKLFGNINPVNHTVKMDGQWDLQVTGVYEDLPKNSTFFNAGYFAPLDRYLEGWANLNVWDNYNMWIYVQTIPGSNFENTSSMIKNAIKQNNPHQNEELFLHPMSKWYLHSEFINGSLVTSQRMELLIIMISIAIMVLLLACINYMNLSTACSHVYAKEVGVRKALGSKRISLVQKFAFESFLTSIIAFLLALILVMVILPWFCTISGKTLNIPWTNVYFWLLCVLFIIITNLLSGAYPAIYLSSFQPLKALSGSIKQSRWGINIREFFVVFQFTISIALIIASLVIYKQVVHSKNRPVGYTPKGLIVLNMNTPDYRGKYAILKDELKNTGAVEEITAANYPITDTRGWNNNYNWTGKDENIGASFNVVYATPSYAKTMNLKFVEGRDFLPDRRSDMSGAIINESAKKLMGLNSPIGEVVIRPELSPVTIIGVVCDMVKGSPYEPTDPVFIFPSEDDLNWLYIRINPNLSVNNALSKIQPVINKIVPLSPFDFSFVDVQFNDKFKEEVQFGDLVLLFTILAILISCLGLFGFAAFLAESRTKEIGIRRVNGAKVFEILVLLTNNFTTRVLIACLIACPVSWYCMNFWLEGFSYRTTMSWWIFFLACIGAVFIALLTVSWQTFRAARRNPVEALRYE